MHTTQELSVNLKCLVLRNGIEVWKEAKRMDQLCKQLISQSGHRFFEVDGEVINTADILGIFSSQTMNNLTRRKNGGWQCNRGNWHDKQEKCVCPTNEQQEYMESRARAILECGKCKDGWIQFPGKNSVTECECALTLEHSTEKRI